jgi:hypothetical protein
MPDFDKNLQSIIKDSSIPMERVDLNEATPAPRIDVGRSDFSDTTLQKNTTDDAYDILNNLSKRANFKEKGIFVTDATLKANQRYDKFNPIVSNQEDYVSYNQSVLSKGVNGILKGTNLAATTIAGGFAMLGGTVSAAFTGRLADIWDNEGLRNLDKWNNKVDQEYLPNYYSDVEKESNWYSTDNWMTANFLFDKLIKNSGYAVGAMVSGNIANAAIGVAGRGLGSATAALANASRSSQAFKLFTPILRNSARAFSAAKNVEAAAILDKGVSSIADITAKSSRLAELAKTTNIFASINDTARRTAVAAYSSAGEASFEALQTANEFRNNLIEKYKLENYGQEPTGSILEGINMEAEKVGKTSFLGNLALLSVTEFAQLPYLMGSSYRASKQAANNLVRQADDVVLKGGVYAAKTPATKFGKLYQKTKRVGQYVFDPKEAGQEIGQYALQVGTNNYFNKSRESNDADVLTDGFLYGLFGKDELGKDVGALVSKEGIEGGILGGITGGIMQAKGNYLKDKSVATNTQQFVNSLNSTPSFKEAFIDRLSAVNRAVTLQKQQQDAIVSGDELESKDIKADLVHNYLTPRIKYGRFDMVMEDLAELKQTGVTTQGLASLKEQGLANINDTTTSFQQRISTLESTAKNTEQLYRALNLRYSGEMLTDAEGAPVLSPDGKQLRKYSDEVIDKLVYASSKIADYDLRIPQVNGGLSQAGVSTMDVLQGIILDGKPNKIATEEALSQINKLDVTSDVKDELKTQLSDVIELSLRRKLFIEEYDDIKSNPLNYTYGRGYGADENIDTSLAVVEQKEKLEGEKKTKIVNAELEIGKEYSLKESIRKEGTELQLAPKITVVAKTLGGEFEVRLPNGKIKFLTPTEFKEYNISDKENRSEEFTDILNKAIDTVIARPEYSEIGGIELAPGESKLDFINALDNQALVDDIEKEFNDQTKELIKLREEEEAKKQKLLKNSEQINKEQTALQLNSGTVSTPDTSTLEFAGEEGKLKDFSIFFLSSVGENENDNDPTKSAPYIKRSIEFLNNINNFSNRGQMKSILVTPNQIDDLGLTGLVQMSYNKNANTPLENIDDVLDIDKGLIVQVFVIQKGKDLFFVNKEGQPLTKLGEQVDLEQVVFKRMPTTETKDGSGRPRYRADQKEEFEAAAKGWRILREQLFSAPANIVKSYSFDVSRGIPIEIKNADGIVEKNQVGGILVPENKISTQEGLIVVPTTGSITHKGQILKYPNGVPVLQYGDTLQFLNNKKFNNREAKGIFEVIKALAADMISQSEAGKTIRINREYSYFLQNVLFWKDKAGAMGDNQIRINVSDLAIDLGKESYPLTEIVKNETQIVNQLQEIYNNVNNETLKKNFNQPFTEFYIDKTGTFTTSEWTNYQTYLLSANYPSGPSRPASETPLSTSVAKSTESVPYSFKQKYATLEGLELPVVKVVPKPVVAAPVETIEVPVVDGFVLDGTTPHKYKLKVGDIEFTAIPSAKKDVPVTLVSSENNIAVIESIAKNPTLLNDNVIPTLKQINKFDATQKDEEQVAEYIRYIISANLSTKLKAQAPIEAPAAPVVEEKEEVVLEEEEPEVPKKPDANKFKGFKGPKNQYRIVGLDKKDRMTDADFQLFKEWHAANASTIPYEVLDNIITTNTGEKAWGVFEKNVVKFVKGGLRGTEYHEIGEAIWKGMLTTEEQQAILDQERARPGTFKDRASGKTYSYDDAKVSDKILKERIMDDFADYRLGKLPAKSLGERVRRFFKMIMDFFKTFGTKPSLKEELFKAIDTGKFKERELRQPEDNEFAEYRAAENLTEQQTHEFVQDITARAAGILFTEGDKKLLFNPLSITADQMFDQIEQEYSEETDEDGFSRLDLLGEKAWEELKIKTQQSLRTLGITFNEEEEVNDDQTNRDYAQEPFSTDWKKNSSGAIKFSLSTLLETFATNQEDGSLVLELPLARTDNSIGGYRLLNFSRAFATVLGKLSNTTSVSKMVDKLYDLSFDDPNYVRLFSRVGGKLDRANGKVTKHIPFNEFTNDDWKYFIQFYQTFTKQKPDALIQYKTGNEVYIAPANLFTAIKQTKQGWVENIKAIAKDSAGFIKYNRADKTYNVDSEKLKEKSIKKPKDQIAFLGNIGINFEFDVYTNLKKYQKQSFSEAVDAIYKYLGTTPGIMSVTGETLGVDGRITKLAELYNKVTNPNQESTYFGVENQRIGSFSDSNAPSVFENEFNEANTLDELLASRPELNDIFSANSQVLKKGGLFFDKDGNRIKEVKIGYIQGTKQLNNNKGYKTTKLGLGDRFTQEINNNLEGNYYVLLPGDSSTEWMMNLGNNILLKDVESGKALSNINSIFRGYLSDDIALALDADNRKQLKNVKGKAKELRFFKDILFDTQLEDINNMIEANATQEQIEEYINSKENIGEINEAIQVYIQNTVKDTKDVLMANSQAFQVGENTFAYPGLLDAFATKEKFNKNNLSEKTLNDIITFTNVNYIINNIEYHKILFGDPYQFAIEGAKLEETKRIKSFLSPRRVTFDSPEYNTYLNENANQVDGIQLLPGDYGYQAFKSYSKTISVKEVKLAGSLSNIIKAYDNTKEADAASWLMDGTYREIKLKNGQWSDEAEDWHQWQMAFTRQNIPGYVYTNDALKKHDEALVKTDAPKHTIEVLKPIVSGNKFGENKINLVLDKFSQMPIYYSMVKGTSLEKMYEQMFKQGIGYAVVESGRKVGVDSTHSLYNADGSFNTEAFNKDTIVSVPWKSYGIQVETTAEGEKEQTRGSQLVKIASMDLFDNGVPSSPEAKAEYERNTDILNKMHENAYNELLVKLGVEDMDNGFKLVNGKAVSETLMYEMLRRDVSDNTIDAIQLDENDQFRIPFEAAPSYLQIRNIMYSMIDKAILRPKMSGGSHVQVPVTMFESATKGRELTMKTDKGWVKITKEQYNKLSDDQKKQVALTDSTLKFYTKDAPYCEILLPHWFKDKFKNKTKFPNDEAILKYLNETKEGKAILTGIGFRIPTQALSSVEVFKVKGFLPQYMGATVVVPSEITTKAGSDFDIDKLNMYLKSTYVDRTGNVRLVKYLDSEADTKEFYGKVFEDTLVNKAFKKSELLEALQITIYDLKDPKNLSEKYSEFISTLLSGAEDYINTEESIIKEIEDLQDSSLQSFYKEKYVKDMYKKSLENEYYDSLEKLITLPENFDRLISPVNDAGLEKLSERLNSLRGYDENLIKNRILDRNYMTKLRHAFVTAKRWVGIAAVNITNLSLKQKSQVYIDPSRFDLIPTRDASFIKDGSVILKHNTTIVGGKPYISLSGTTVKDSKELISNRLSGYTTAFVDVANKPYITDVVQSDLVVSTFMFLENIGSGEQAAMFLNQPIISEYLKMLDGAGEKTLFTLANIKDIKARFPATSEEIDRAVIDLEMLSSNILYFYEKGYFKLSNDNAVQHKIFDEFLKYAKMAEYGFKFTQATNYDTSSFNNNSVYDRKTWNTEIASDTNIISSVDDILNNTFIGKQKEFLGKSMQSMGAIFKLEEDAFRAITNKILQPFGENPFMTADDFEKLSNKVKADFLDYIIQTKTGVNSRIKELLVNENTSVAVRLEKAKKKYPDVQILRELQVVSGERPDGAKSVKLVANIKDAYDNNMYVGMMRELRDYNDELNQLYKDLIYVSILQGTYQSSISIKNVIPIEDYSEIVQPVIVSLTDDGSLDAFAEGMFHANNFKDDDIMPLFNPKFFLTSDVPIEQLDSFGNYYADIYEYYSSLFPNIDSFSVKSSERKILFVSEKYNYIASQKNYIKIPRVVTDNKTGDSIDIKTGMSVTKLDYAVRKAKGDYSLNDVYGYARVNYPNTNIPLTTIDKKGETQYVFKLINLYGDGNRASEFYEDFRPSVLENGTAIMDQIIPNKDIIEYYGGEITAEDVPSQELTIQESPNMTEFNKLPSKSEVPTMTYSGIGSRETPKEILNQMTEVAKELESKGYTLNTGITFRGIEEGADKAFSQGATKKNLFAPERAGEKEKVIAKEVHPNPGALTQGGLQLMARNTNQIFGANLDTPVDFVLFYAQETSGIRPKGGTGQAVEMARRKGIPAINMADSNWREQLNNALQTSQLFTNVNAPEGLPEIDRSSETCK